MRRFATIGVLTGILLLGWWLRIFLIDRTAFRGDEAFTVQHWVLQPISATLTSDTIVIDPHPPLSYALFRAWSQIAGISEFALRILPALLNMLGIAAIARLGRTLHSEKLGLLLEVLWALHAFLIWHSQDARNYAIWSGFSVLALSFAISAVRYNRRDQWALYIMTALLAAYTYYLEIFILAALNITFLITCFHDRVRLRRWIYSQVIIALCLSPWYLYLFQKLRSGLGYGGTTGGFEPLKLVTWFIPTLTFGDTILLSPGWGFLLTGIIITGVLLLWSRNWRHGLLVAALIIIPMIGIGLVSTRLNVFTPRYILASIPAYLIAIGMLITTLWRRRSVYASLAFALLSGWVLLSGISIWNGYFNPAYQKAPDWRILASFLRQHIAADELVIQTGADAAFGYYYRQQNIASAEIALPAQPSQPSQEIEDHLAAISPDYESIWITGQTFPDWQNAGIVENWAETHLQQVRETIIEGIPVSQFKAFTPLENEYGGQSVAFAGTVTLVGTNTLPVTPDGRLFVWTYWQPRQPTEADLKVFVHLTGAWNPDTQSPLWEQDDHLPLNGLISTTSWQPGIVFRDVAEISVADLPDGEYQIVTGWYDPLTMTRLSSENNTDTVLVDTIIINK